MLHPLELFKFSNDHDDPEAPVKREAHLLGPLCSAILHPWFINMEVGNKDKEGIKACTQLWRLCNKSKNRLNEETFAQFFSDAKEVNLLSSLELST